MIALAVGALESVCKVLTWISIAIMSFLAFPMIYDVVLRTAGYPTIWAYETTTYALIAGTFLANAATLREGKHFRVTFLLKMYPHLRLLLNRFAIGATLAFGLFLLVAGSSFVIEAYTMDLRAPTLLNTPLYLPRLAIPLGALGLSIQSLILLITDNYPDLHEVRVD